MKAIVISIFNKMASLSDRYTKFTEDAKHIDENFIGIERECRSANLKAQFESDAAKACDSISSDLDRLKDKAEALDTVTADNMQNAKNTAELLKAPNLGNDALQKILAQFIGMKTCLELLKVNAADEYKDIISGMIYAPASAIEECKSNLATLVTSPEYQTPHALGNIRQILIQFCKKEGIELTPAEIAKVDEIRYRNIESLVKH